MFPIVTFSTDVFYCHFNLEVYFFSIDFYTSRIAQITNSPFFFFAHSFPLEQKVNLKKIGTMLLALYKSE